MKGKKRRGPYRINVSRTFGGRGAMKCALCGQPIVTHETMELCKGVKPK